MEKEKTPEEKAQYELWKKLAEIAHNAFSPFDGRIEADTFIENGMAEFELKEKTYSMKPFTPVKNRLIVK